MAAEAARFSADAWLRPGYEPTVKRVFLEIARIAKVVSGGALTRTATCAPVHEFEDDETALIAAREVYEDFLATEAGEKVLAGQTNRPKPRYRLRSSTDCNELREPLSDRCLMIFSDDWSEPSATVGLSPRDDPKQPIVI